MPFSTASLSGGNAFLSHFFTSDHPTAPPCISHLPLKHIPYFRRCSSLRKIPLFTPKASVSSGSSSKVDGVDQQSPDELRSARRSADWKSAGIYFERGSIYKGKVEGFNNGGLRIRFYSLVGFLPFPQLSPSYQCKEPNKTIQEIARGLVGSILSVKVIEVSEDMGRLVFSEKEANWMKFSSQIKTGDIFEGRVGFVEDFGAFIHLRFPDGCYHLTGFVHVSEVSWDLVHDVRDVLKKGNEVRVKVIKIDSGKSRLSLSIKQLEDDPLLETLDKVIHQDSPLDPSSLNSNGSFSIEPLPGLETIMAELMQEDGIQDIKISRQGFEKRVVSQDLQLWLSNAPPVGEQFTLLARAGRQVQEIQLTTSLDQQGIKMALQRVLERIP
nr:30S ribosomal protein S1-like [Ipomoea batatas]